jgi:hypothetical protein
MFVPFDSLPDSARIWIYQSSRKFDLAEVDIISRELLSFTEQWEVHGKPMKASYKLCFDQFIILAADEGHNEASGCSIDGSVRVLKNLGSRLNLDLFDRNAVAFKKEEVSLIPLSALKQRYREDGWSKDTLVFNNLVATKGDLSERWLVKAGNTWLTRYMTDETVKL